MAGRARGAAAALLVLAGLGSAGEALAQAAPSRFTYATRYDASDKVVGTLQPDADGVAPFTYAAVRNTYDAAGRLILVEKGWLTSWQSESVAPANWGAAFQVRQKIETTYDSQDRKLTEWSKGWDTATSTWKDVGLTQYSYDAAGRLECTALRMNPALYGSLPASACTMGAAGTGANDFGPDRITKTVYDAAGQVLQVREGVGSSAESAEATYSYTLNGKKAQVIDANGNRAELRYDGFDRQVKWVFPADVRPAAYNDATPASAVASAGSLNEADYEEYGYDADGNRTSLRKRDGSVLTYSFDALNRMTRKSVPARPAQAAVSGQASSGATPALASTHTRDVFYSYDLRGLQTQAMFEDASNGGVATGEGLTTQYDGFGRNVSASQVLDSTTRTLTALYDANGNRTRLTYPDGLYVAYAYDDRDKVTALRENGATSGLGALLSYSYDDLDRVIGIVRGNGDNSGIGYEPGSRLLSLGHDFAGTAADVGWGYGYNPASQLTQVGRNNDSYAWSGHYNVDRSYSANGLNQYTAAGAASFCYDRNGNLVADSGNVYIYDIENRLVERRVRTAGESSCAALTYAGAQLAQLRYDPAGRLYELLGTVTGTTRFLNDGDAMVGEYAAAGTLLRRYVHGSDLKADDPLVWYEGVGTADRRWLHADERGSIVTVSDASGSAIAINIYDEYGVPAAANQGRFTYTGQAWLQDLGMYHYKARIYSPTLGRFMQTDPIGYEDQVNLYAYVGNDPVNVEDFSGECPQCVIGGGIVVARACAANPVCRGAAIAAGRWIARQIIVRVVPAITPQKNEAQDGDGSTTSNRPAGSDGKRGSTGGPGAGKRFPPESPDEKAAKEGAPCRYCGKETTNEPGRPNSRERDHIDPKSRGGNNSPENEGNSCRSCNRSKGAKNPDEWTPKEREALYEWDRTHIRIRVVSNGERTIRKS